MWNMEYPVKFTCRPIPYHNALSCSAVTNCILIGGIDGMSEELTLTSSRQ